MADVSIDTDQLKEVVTSIVNDAHEDGSIDELTPRMIRTKAEVRIGLKSGSLDVWKDIVKAAAGEAIDALDAPTSQPGPAPSSEPEDEEKDAKGKGRKPAKNTKPPSSTSKATRKTKKSESTTDSAGAKRKSKASKEDIEVESGSPPSKKTKLTSSAASSKKAEAKKPPTKEKPASSSAKTKGGKIGKGKTVRSASVISSSDEDEPSKPTSTSSPKLPAKSKPKPNKRPSLPKNSSAHDADVSTADVADTHEDPVKPKSKLSESMTAVDVHEGVGEEKGEKKDASDSEMSVLVDEEPAKKRKGKKSKDANADSVSKRATAKPKGRTKAKAKDEDEDPEDAEIKRLKSFVSGCGVRKVWSREFLAANISPSDKRAQIKYLRDLLKELGMDGRLSMDKAKKVREKRELQRELEDVQTFEKAVVHGSSSRPSRRASNPESSISVKGATTSGGNESDVEDEEDEELGVVIKRKPNARQSIMAFLGDQSESE
ncbi:hypothetical protein BDY19DRAFT_991274 [Irpex rosettiformis]|uniref:Uncharacterized protein n=1 Tax=Irpex rosettiformis TaxID=378272 RepID=A0ACB8UBZ5_9APHY|nr:hypothetical protein BDY19DRAFT_991274 [Irpex rosettiformis]